MKRKIFMILFVGTTLLTLMGLADRGFGEARVNVAINVPPPPPILIPAPPRCSSSPGPMSTLPLTWTWMSFSTRATGIALTKDIGIGPEPTMGSGSTFPQEGASCPHQCAPRFPPCPPGHRHIPYGDVKQNWRSWERDKYWEKHGGREWHGEERREHDPHDHDRGGGRHKD